MSSTSSRLMTVGSFLYFVWGSGGGSFSFREESGEIKIDPTLEFRILWFKVKVSSSLKSLMLVVLSRG